MEHGGRRLLQRTHPDKYGKLHSVPIWIPTGMKSPAWQACCSRFLWEPTRDGTRWPAAFTKDTSGQIREASFRSDLDSDGNEIAGVASVLLQVPLGTYTGWNTVAGGFYKGHIRTNTGSFIPFRSGFRRE